MSIQIEDIILHNITTLEKIQNKNKQGNRNITNKWFQDSIKAYFMQKQAAKLLMEVKRMMSIKELKELIKSNLSQEFPIYISIILRYFELIREHRIEKEFTRNLIKEMYQMEYCIPENFVQNYAVEKKIRTSFVSYLIYNYFMYFLCNNDLKQINNYFQIWSLSFPENEMKGRRRNFSQMKLEKCSQNKNYLTEELSSSCR